jgi:glyoxylase-like metal-dependent hydrolase (beta-lactamase superfamily II)
MLRFSATCILALAVAHSAATQPISDPRDLEFTRVTEDIHVAFRPDPLRYWVEGNVTLIFNENDVVVVDGSGSNRSAKQVIDYIESLTDKPVTVLINTHGHGDHTIGNSVYAERYPGVEIVSRPETYKYLTGRGIGYVAQIAESIESRRVDGAEEIRRLMASGGTGVEDVVANLREYYDHDIFIRQEAYQNAQIAPPTMTIGDRLTLRRENRTIDVRYLGPGDTHGDLIVYLPDDKVVVTGDMVVHPFPYGFSRHALEWVNTLDSLALLEFQTLIPGHGEIQEGKSYLSNVKEILIYVQDGVRAAIADGLSLEETVERIDLSTYKDQFAGADPVTRYYFDEYFAKPNVERTYFALTED